MKRYRVYFIFKENGRIINDVYWLYAKNSSDAFTLTRIDLTQLLRGNWFSIKTITEIKRY